MPDNFRLGIFSIYDLKDFSAIPHFIHSTFAKMRDVTVVHLPPGAPYAPSLSKRLSKRAERLLTGRQYLWEKEPARCQHISRQLDDAVGNYPVDAALLFGTEGCAYSRTKIPLFCYADSIFGTRIDMYPDQLLASLSQTSIREGVMAQQLGLDRLTKLFLSSRWALAAAISRFDYRVIDKCEVVYIGANLPFAPRADDIKAHLLFEDSVHFLWLGSWWDRKGGELALEIIAELHNLGVNAILDVVGPVKPARSFPWLRLHGKLSYEIPEQFTILKQIYYHSYGLLLPSKGDTTPLVISEAFAFGCPAITSAVGGIPEMVRDEETGLLFTSYTPKVWAERIRGAMASGLFLEMRPNCRREFDTRLNWETVCQKMLAAMLTEHQKTQGPLKAKEV